MSGLTETERLWITWIGKRFCVKRRVVVANESVSQAGSSDLGCSERRIRRFSLPLENQRALFGAMKQADVDATSINLEVVQEASGGSRCPVGRAPQRQTVRKRHRRQVISVEDLDIGAPPDDGVEACWAMPVVVTGRYVDWQWIGPFEDCAQEGGGVG